MEIKAELILASKNALTDDILYTWVLTYPRFILAEVNTHRMLSRNTASSRAIPSWKQRQRVWQYPVVPVSVGSNQKGMQAGAEIGGWRRAAIVGVWKTARLGAIAASWAMDKLGAHKQLVNRIVEPWTWTQQIVTATDVKNLFKLRTDGMAEPHFQILAKQMKAQAEKTATWFNDVLTWNGEGLEDRQLELPHAKTMAQMMQVLRPGEYHAPFVTAADLFALREKSRQLMNSPVFGKQTRTEWDLVKRVSTARCARVSYYLPDSGERSDIGSDLRLHDRLSSSGHWSPFEHVATPQYWSFYNDSNFKGWRQYRKEFLNEHGGDRE